jgi:hypothetical protein
MFLFQIRLCRKAVVAGRHGRDGSELTGLIAMNNLSGSPISPIWALLHSRARGRGAKFLWEHATRDYRSGTVSEDENGLRGRVAKQSEEAIGKFAQELLESPVISGALSAVFDTRERATRAQEVAMSALNLPTASDIERLTRRVRSVSQRLEGLEDGLDRVVDQLGGFSGLDKRLTGIEESLARVEAALAKPAAKKPAAAK